MISFRKKYANKMAAEHDQSKSIRVKVSLVCSEWVKSDVSEESLYITPFPE